MSSVTVTSWLGLGTRIAGGGPITSVMIGYVLTRGGATAARRALRRGRGRCSPFDQQREAHGSVVDLEHRLAAGRGEVEPVVVLRRAEILGIGGERVGARRHDRGARRLVFRAPLDRGDAMGSVRPRSPQAHPRAPVTALPWVAAPEVAASNATWISVEISVFIVGLRSASSCTSCSATGEVAWSPSSCAGCAATCGGCDGASPIVVASPCTTGTWTDAITRARCSARSRSSSSATRCCSLRSWRELATLAIELDARLLELARAARRAAPWLARAGCDHAGARPRAPRARHASCRAPSPSRASARPRAPRCARSLEIRAQPGAANTPPRTPSRRRGSPRRRCEAARAGECARRARGGDAPRRARAPAPRPRGRDRRRGTASGTGSPFAPRDHVERSGGVVVVEPLDQLGIAHRIDRGVDRRGDRSPRGTGDVDRRGLRATDRPTIGVLRWRAGMPPSHALRHITEGPQFTGPEGSSLVASGGVSAASSPSVAVPIIWAATATRTSWTCSRVSSRPHSE